MAQRDRSQLIQVTPRGALSLLIVRVAAAAAAEALHAGRYPKPTDAQFTSIASAVSEAALAMPSMIADMAATTDRQLEEAAETLGFLAVSEVLGPPPGAC
jgi:hypothetical protein